MKKKRRKTFFFFHLFVGQRKQFKNHGIQKTNKKNYDSTASSTRKIFITRARRKDQIQEWSEAQKTLRSLSSEFFQISNFLKRISGFRCLRRRCEIVVLLLSSFAPLPPFLQRGYISHFWVEGRVPSSSGGAHGHVPLEAALWFVGGARFDGAPVLCGS